MRSLIPKLENYSNFDNSAKGIMVLDGKRQTATNSAGSSIVKLKQIPAAPAPIPSLSSTPSPFHLARSPHTFASAQTTALKKRILFESNGQWEEI